MTSRNILIRSISKATANGFKFDKDMIPELFLLPNRSGIYYYEPYRNQLNGLLFSHDFAKAFWGEEQIPFKTITSGLIPKMDMEDTIPSWQYYLQQMVLEENPIKYLEKFL